ncbi:MAG: helix-turn-helix domain-containing protein [Anaerotignum sp.]|nr:helix-turn-helix domain-containing protein [Anaerotignum sp.]
MEDVTVVSESELAERLGMSVYAVRKLRNTEGMPCFKARGRVFYRLQVVLEWMRERKKIIY